jgi:SPP1 family phage portal protein
MYLTVQDQVKLKVDIDSLNTSTDTLSTLIEDDKVSTEKIAMQKGVNYYKGKHDVLNKKFNTYVDKGNTIVNPNAPNNHIVNMHSTLQIDQKANYINSKEINFRSEQEGFEDDIKETLSEMFPQNSLDWIKESSKKGFEAIQVFINEDGKFDYAIEDAIGLIPVFDTHHLRKLIGMYKYFTFEELVGDEIKERIHLEYWDENTVTIWQQKDISITGTPNLQFMFVEKKGHFEFTNSQININGQTGWGRVPFIILPNNKDKTTDLSRIKSKIDSLDLQMSVLENEIGRMAKGVFGLGGFAGTKEQQEEAMTKLKNFGIIINSGDLKLSYLKADLAYEAAKEHIAQQEDDVYELGMAVNNKSTKLGNDLSSVVLKMLYEPLDQKANAFILGMKTSLRELMWFVAEYLANYKKGAKKQYDHEEVKFIFNKSIPRNTKEEVEILNMSTEHVPFEDLVAKHPLNENPQEALDKLKIQMPIEDNTLDEEGNDE